MAATRALDKAQQKKTRRVPKAQQQVQQVQPREAEKAPPTAQPTAPKFSQEEIAHYRAQNQRRAPSYGVPKSVRIKPKSVRIKTGGKDEPEDLGAPEPVTPAEDPRSPFPREGGFDISSRDLSRERQDVTVRDVSPSPEATVARPSSREDATRLRTPPPQAVPVPTEEPAPTQAQAQIEQPAPAPTQAQARPEEEVFDPDEDARVDRLQAQVQEAQSDLARQKADTAKQQAKHDALTRQQQADYAKLQQARGRSSQRHATNVDTLYASMHSKLEVQKKPAPPPQFPLARTTAGLLPSPPMAQATALPEEVGERRSPDEVERSEPEPRRTEQQPARRIGVVGSNAALRREIAKGGSKVAKEQQLGEQYEAKQQVEKELAEGLAAGQVRLEQGHHELTKQKAAFRQQSQELDEKSQNLDEAAKQIEKQRKTLVEEARSSKGVNTPEFKQCQDRAKFGETKTANCETKTAIGS